MSNILEQMQIEQIKQQAVNSLDKDEYLRGTQFASTIGAAGIFCDFFLQITGGQTPGILSWLVILGMPALGAIIAQHWGNYISADRKRAAAFAQSAMVALGKIGKHKLAAEEIKVLILSVIAMMLVSIAPAIVMYVIGWVLRIADSPVLHIIVGGLTLLVGLESLNVGWKAHKILRHIQRERARLMQ